MNTAEELLERIGDRIQVDVLEQHPDGSTEYDIYVETLRNSKFEQAVVGVIDMGELYQGVYTWDGAKWHEDNSWGNPAAVRDRIVKHRGFNARF